MTEKPENTDSPQEELQQELNGFRLRAAKATFRDLLPVLLTEVLLSGLMLGVYALLHRLSRGVLLGAALGTGLELLNFAVMTISLLRAEQTGSTEKGQLSVRGIYLLRMVVLIVALIFALKSGWFDPLATLLPLCFMRLAVFAGSWKKNSKKGGEP